MVFNQVRRFVLVESLSSDVASLDASFEKDQLSSNGFICEGCKAIKPDAENIGVVTVEGVIKDAPFGQIISGLGIAKREFLYSLGVNVIKKYLYTGDVINYKGKPLDNWVTYHAKYRFPVRGEALYAGYRFCDVCRQLFYFSSGKQYLYPAPPEDIEILGDVGTTSLIMTEDLANKLKNVIEEKKWRRVKFTDLPILDEPLDGLGNFLYGEKTGSENKIL